MIKISEGMVHFGDSEANCEVRVDVSTDPWGCAALDTVVVQMTNPIGEATYLNLKAEDAGNLGEQLQRAVADLRGESAP